MQSKIIQVAGLGFTIAYAAFIVWIYATEPRTFKEVTTSAEVAAGVEAVNRAIALSPGGPLTIDDPDLHMHAAAELKAELEQGLERNWSDVNPLKVLRTRK